MDKETKVAYEIVRQRIVENLDRLEDLQAQGVKVSGDVNSLKRWRRYGAAFAWDPEVFQDVLENPTMDDAKLLSSLRAKETRLMKNFGVIDKIPLHHIIANRTGGDLGIRTPVDQWLEVRDRVFQATGARPGNSQANLNAAGQFDELAHLGRTGAKGSVFADTGIERRADFPVLHRAGQNLAAKAGEDPKLVLGTAQEQAEALIPSVEQQQARFAETTATPEVQAQRQVLTKAGYPEAFAADTPIERIQEIATEIRGTEIPKQFAMAFDFSGGVTKLGMKFGALLPGIGVGFDVLEAKEKTERAAQTQAPLDKLQAGIAQVTAATAPIPEPISQGINFAGGAVNFVIDALRAPVTPVTEEDLDFATL